MAGIQDLPRELLLNVSRRLRKDALKQLRLVCTHVSGPATAVLCQNMTYTVMKSLASLSNMHGIVQSNVAQHVQTVLLQS